MIAQFPLGGVAWDYLQYVIGLAEMGHDVYYYEDSYSWSYHPVKKQYVEEGDYAGEYLGEFFKRYAPELKDHWRYWHLRKDSFGIEQKKFEEILRTADLFINVSGACSIPEELPKKSIKVFLDTDPGYNQIMLSEKFSWSDNVERWCKSVASHDQHFTYAENINHPDCLLPKVGYSWKTTRMPVVSRLWDQIAQTPVKEKTPWTTIMTWSAFRGKLIYEGEEYKSKGHEFEKLMDLPKHTNVSLKIGVGGHGAPMEKLKVHGWHVVDGPETTLTPSDYQDFISESRGEVSVAKHVYVAMRTGWFSCRSACYLAAGRPVVVQDTGFTSMIPSGRGLITFSNWEEAKEGIERVEKDYMTHQKGAQARAHEYFGAEKVLGKMLNDMGLS